MDGFLKSHLSGGLEFKERHDFRREFLLGFGAFAKRLRSPTTIQISTMISDRSRILDITRLRRANSMTGCTAKSARHWGERKHVRRWANWQSTTGIEEE